MTSFSASLPAHPIPAQAAGAARSEAHPAYRADVDGLRAVAVVSVLLFHFFPTVLPGGFVGVDIFFVISGYLISGIILGELRQDRFSFARFYARRIRRIFPALVLVMAASLAFGWIALLAMEYARLGTHATAGAAFVSNLLLWSESGYFDPAATTKPFLHLWSLGVEEQFYLVWPVVLCLAWRLRAKLKIVLATLALLSFAANIAATHADPVAAFYSPVTRLWELAVGALLAAGELQRHPAAGDAWTRALQRPRFALVLSAAGTALVLLALVFARERNFPGWQALLPTAGAALLILAGPRSPFNRMLLSCAPLVAVGLVSYPLYLWHWPLLSLSRIVHGELGPAMKAMLLVLAAVLAVLTFHWIERPVRAARRRLAITLLLAGLMTVVGGAGVVLAACDGLEQRSVVRSNVALQPWRTGHRALPFATECSWPDSAGKPLIRCLVDRRESPRFALLGDSKAEALFPGVFGTARPGGTWMYLGSGSTARLVPVVSDSALYSYVDPRVVDIALRLVERSESVRTVVIATATRALFGLGNDDSIAQLPDTRNYATALAGLDATVTRLLAAGKQVVLVVDNPTLPHMEDCIARSTSSSLFNHLLQARPNPACRITVARHLELSRPYRAMLNALLERHPAGLSLFDTVPLLCDQGLCTPTRDGHLLYGLTDHLSDYASGLVGEALNAHLNRAEADQAR